MRWRVIDQRPPRTGTRGLDAFADALEQLHSLLSLGSMKPKRSSCPDGTAQRNLIVEHYPSSYTVRLAPEHIVLPRFSSWLWIVGTRLLTRKERITTGEFRRGSRRGRRVLAGRQGDESSEPASLERMSRQIQPRSISTLRQNRPTPHGVFQRRCLTRSTSSSMATRAATQWHGASSA